MASPRFGDSDAYFRALAAVDRAGIPPRYRGMLETRYSAPHHTITMAILAKAVGYKNSNAANLHYGTLAHRIGEQLGITRAPLSDTYPNGFWGYVLMDWAKGPGAAGHSAFVMRPEMI